MSEYQNQVLISVYVQPGGKKNEILGVFDNKLKLRIHAPPVDGKANEAAAEYLANLFNLPRKNVTLYRGTTSRVKQFVFSGVTLTQAQSSLEQLLIDWK